MKQNINELVAALPDAPGCYIYWDSAGDCLYVGKSKRVKSRVRSYFGKHNPPKTQKLAKLIARIEYRPAADEIDALYLEHSLIKTYRPPFNSQMKKDPHPTHICIQWGRAKPGLYISDKPGPKAVGYGSFGSAYDAKEALTLINRAWLTPICENQHFDNTSPAARGCLNLHIGRCLGPCQPGETQGHRENLLKAAAFMEGRNQKSLISLRREMRQASHDLDFEKAARLRDALKNLHYLQRRFTYRVPFAGKRLCVFIKGYNEPGFLLMYYRNGQLRHVMRFANLDEWPHKRDDFIATMINPAIAADNLVELAHLYTSTATQEIRACKYYTDVSKTRKQDLPRRLDKAVNRFMTKR